MHSYIVCIDPNIRLPVEASNASEAKEEAWKQIAGGFTFGNNKKAFMQKARVVTIETSGASYSNLKRRCK